MAAVGGVGGAVKRPDKKHPLLKQFVEENDQPLKISSINFGLMSIVDMMRCSEFHVTSRDLYVMPSRGPATNGVNDPRLGVSDKKSLCQTCHMKLADCTGHYGYIKLELPVFHIGFFKQCLNILSNICKTCSRVLLPEDERETYLKRIRDQRGDALKKMAIRKRITDRCKKVRQCPYCNALNGQVKKVNGAHSLKIVHDKYRGKDAEDVKSAFFSEFSEATRHNRELGSHLSKAQEDLNPAIVQKLFEGIIDEDCDLLWTDPATGRPENLILQGVLVPPVAIRPSVSMDTGNNEDDLTVKLQEIIHLNNALRTALQKGASMKMVMENWDFLQVQVAQYFNGDMPGLPRQLGSKPIRGLCQRLKGKQGRFRGNLSGKRVDFSGRTVISPDPNLRIDQVGVPEHVAKTMTFPDRVNRYNIEKLRKCVINGPEKHPGANFIRPAEEGSFPRSLLYGDRVRLAEELKFGDVVERHMADGDIVLFNRQPSLHKMSIMSHRVKVMPWRTFRFNECVCAPYNADFDGDEMNLHLPQTEEARTEAIELMGVQQNLITPRNGEPLVAATQDFLTASYLLTQKNVFFTRDEFCQIVSYLSDAGEEVDIPPPAILKPYQLWTGKQVMSMLVCPRNSDKLSVNLELKERNYSGSGLYMCKNDGYVCFRDSELVSGNCAKKTLGDGTKKGLFYVLVRDHGNAEAARCMNRLAKLAARWLGGHRGFTIGIDDVTPSEELKEKKRELLDNGYKRANETITAYRKGQLTLKAGCDSLQSLESELNGLLGKLRETAGGECMKALPFHNNPRIMAECGSKGSALNISQMVACVGQQSVGGKRIAEGFINRTLPHFMPFALHAAAKGFVANSFYSGLTATEFFFHTMGGREGLVDTAVKTAETGYMARRLMKALEDLSAQYDKTVRNSEGSVVQFTYGDDGLNPSYMEGDDRPVDFQRLLKHVLASDLDPRGQRLTVAEIRAMGKATVQSSRFQQLLPEGAKFLEEVKDFFEGLASSVEKMFVEVGVGIGEKEMKDSNKKEKKKGKGAATSVATSMVEPTMVGFDWRKKKQQNVATTKRWIENAASYQEAGELIVDNLHRYTARQLGEVVERALQRYFRAVMEPGEAVGAIGAQSISEPGTQMTLKTFHFAGVASMNVTLGVPRLKEIINASKTISTPIITASLVCKDDERSARIVKGRIEKTTLGEVAEYIKEVFAPEQAYVSVQLDMQAIEQLHLNISAQSVKQALLKGTGTKTGSIIRHLKEKDILLDPRRPGKLKILPPEVKGARALPQRGEYFHVQALKAVLPQVIVCGIPSINRAVINREDTAKGGAAPSFHLLVEGYGLAEVMGAPGVDGLHTKSNHIIEVEATLGIEAARHMISEEINYIMSAYGITIDRRHLMLLSDVMTYKGQVLGITRFGISKMRESVLMLASFEKTADHLFDAAVHSRTDSIVGVSECIIMGVPIPVGTGLFKLLHRAETPALIKKKPLLHF